jgi:hypothetical protein
MAEQALRKRTRSAKKVGEALAILEALNVPLGQRNERSALTLLVLLGMTPRKEWTEAEAPLLGITEMMDRFRKDFGKDYAPNTRETVRRFTVHQFVQMGLLLANPDDPRRPVNSPGNRYQVIPPLLKLARAYGSAHWTEALKGFLRTAKGLRRLQLRERRMIMIPVTFPDGQKLKLRAGGQNELIKKIIEAFCPRFTPGGVIVYVGDTGNKRRHVESGYLEQLGLTLDQHGKMPDVVIHLPEKDWLVLIEAVTSHGPIGLKRHNELKDLFKAAKSGLVFVTAFLTRRAMTKYLGEIAWETEVWVSDAQSHLSHFNGERFLGTYI